MSRNGVVLPIPDSAIVRSLIESWPTFSVYPHPRSVWLSIMEGVLRNLIPGHSSRDYNLTARSLAPFPLAERDWL